MADDKLEIQTAIDTDGVDDGMLNIRNIVTKGMDALNNSVSGCISTVAGLGSAFLNVAETAGKSLLSLGKSAVSVGKNFESSMSQVIATMGVTTDTMTENGENIYDKLSEKAKEMGATTKFSASEAADALNYLALAGYDAEKACDALPQVLNLAQAGGMDLARTSDLVTDAMSALGIDATTENLQHFGDVLAKTASKSNTSVEQLGDALLVCGGQAKMSGLELNEMATMLGIFADNGIKGSEGGTALRNLLKNMYTPTSKAAQAMEQLGISASDAVTGELRPVQEVLMDTMSAMESLSEADRMQAMSDIFDVQVLASASAALNNSSDRFNELSAEIADCDGAMQQMADTMNDNLEGDLAGLNSSLEGLGVEVYESLSDSLRYYVQTGTGYIRQLNDAFKSGGFEGLAGAVGDVLSQALTEITSKIPDILQIASKIVVSFVHGITSQLPLIRAEASGMMRRFSETIQENSPEIVAKATEMIRQFISGISNAGSGLKGLFSTVVGGFLKAISGILPEIASNGAEIIRTFAERIISSKKEMIKCAIPIIQELVQGISDALPKIINVGLAILQNLVSGIINAIPQLLPLATNIITALINGLVQAIVAILQFAPQILTAIINGIISVLSDLIGCAIQILDALITAIIDNLEPILTACIEIVTAIVNGIIDNLDRLIDVAFQLIQFLIDELLKDDNLQKILDAAINILMAVVNGIIDNLDRLIDAVFQLIQFLIDELLKDDNLQKILDAAVNIVMTVADGIIENLDKLIDAAFKIVDKIVSELLQEDNIAKLIDTGTDLLVKIITGLCEFAGRLAEFAGKLFKTLAEELAKIDWSELGKNIFEGIMSGLTGVDFNADEFVGDFGENWIIGFKDFFDIDSPSKLMRDEVGKWLLPGVAVGVEDTSDETADDINNSLKKVSEQLETPIINPPEIAETEFIPYIPERSEIEMEFPQISISEPEIPEPEFELPELTEKTLIISSPEVRIDAPEKIDFTQKIEILREFSPKNSIPELDDERITAEIQSQLDEIMVALNADDFLSRFEAILSGMGNAAVPQYSEVYGQVKTVTEKSENRHSELPQNTQIIPKVSVFIGDTEIKDFVISAIDEANAVSGGVSV